jgi:hypothetical protein
MSQDYDVLAGIRLCAAKLEAAGLAEEGERLLQEMAAAATGGELVMGVRGELKRLIAGGKPLPREVDELARKLISEINATGW